MYSLPQLIVRHWLYSYTVVHRRERICEKINKDWSGIVDRWGSDRAQGTISLIERKVETVKREVSQYNQIIGNVYFNPGLFQKET